MTNVVHISNGQGLKAHDLGSDEDASAFDQEMDACWAIYRAQVRLAGSIGALWCRAMREAAENAENAMREIQK